ncbi:ABC transporter substrate-binding protein [Herminiimonas sp. CN]|uniref:ABC transporter substrate-binding protein n=1 Tax=Herminiimonas sp. CN TaxID=1349818 RepID=UPI000473FC9B|nr:ABC transporter substrate-binding protein [Herminiimonas sp. CN]
MRLLFKPILASAALSVGLVGFTHAAEITVVNFGGANGNAQKAAYIEPFEKATGNKVVMVEYNGELAKVKAMVETKKVSWDVVEIEAGVIGRACEEDLLEKIDYRKIGKKSDFMPEAIHECGVGTFVWSTVLAYNADKLKTAPTGWADFWNVKKFPGKRAMRKGARYNLEFALMADGVPTKDVYKVLATKAGVERAFKKLDELKPNIQWWEAGAQPPQFLVAGDVTMTTAYNGRIDSAQREGKNLQVVWAGSIYDLDYWAIPKGSPNKAAAEKFIAYASSPEAQKNYAGKIAYGPTNLGTMKLLDAKVQANLPSSAKNAKDAVENNLKFWTDHGEDLEQRFTAWAAK